MNALVIAIGIWSHLIVVTAFYSERRKNHDHLGRVTFITAIFGVIYFWVSFGQWVLS
jgi:hypothetical protein